MNNTVMFLFLRSHNF